MRLRLLSAPKRQIPYSFLIPFPWQFQRERSLKCQDLGCVVRPHSLQLSGHHSLADRIVAVICPYIRKASGASVTRGISPHGQHEDAVTCVKFCPILVLLMFACLEPAPWDYPYVIGHSCKHAPLFCHRVDLHWPLSVRRCITFRGDGTLPSRTWQQWIRIEIVSIPLKSGIETLSEHIADV
jgi:hypothetical protein